MHELEEQLKDQEAQAEHNMEEEGRRHREAFSKMERDKNTHLELLNNRYARTHTRKHARSHARTHRVTGELDTHTFTREYKLTNF